MTDIAVSKIAESEPLVSNLRLEKVFLGLQKLITFPIGMEFAATIQEPNTRSPERQAVFLVQSPHPKKKKRALTEPLLLTISTMTLERWREMEADHRHYADLTDPLRPVFAGVVRRHMVHRRELEQLND